MKRREGAPGFCGPRARESRTMGCATAGNGKVARASRLKARLVRIAPFDWSEARVLYRNFRRARLSSSGAERAPRQPGYSNEHAEPAEKLRGVADLLVVHKDV